MKKIEALGPIGFVVRGNKAYYYFKDEEGNPILLEEGVKRKLRVFVRPEKREEAVKMIKELCGCEVETLENVVYNPIDPQEVVMVSVPFNGKPSELENLELKIKTIQGVVGVENKISNFKEQDHFLSKILEGKDFSKRFGYFLSTELFFEEENGVLKLVDFYQRNLKKREEIREQLVKLKESLMLFTVDYESYGGELVLGTVNRSDDFSRTFVVNRNLELEEELMKLLKPYGIEVEVVKEEQKLIERVYEEREKSDIEVIHGSSILEKHKDYETFPSTKLRPSDKFGVKIYYKPVKQIDVVISKGIIPSLDSLYACKFLRPEKRSLEEHLEFFLGDKETLQKTDFEKFRIYKQINKKEDVEKFKKEIGETVFHNSQDARAHLKLAEFLLFDSGFLVLPMLYSISLETTFSKVPEEIGEAILTAEFVSDKILPKITNSYTPFKREKEKIVKSNKKIFAKKFGERYEGRWIYPFYAFVPQILMGSEESFYQHIKEIFKKFFELKDGLEIYGVDEVTRKNILFDPFSFIINCASAYLIFGRKIFTDEKISAKILKGFEKIYDSLKREKFGDCEIIYASPFESKIFITGDYEETRDFVEMLKDKYKFLIAGYNKHEDVFIPLNKNQAIATESGRLVKIGWKGARRSDPMVVKEAEKKILERLVNFGLEEAYSEFLREIDNIEKLRYPLKWYKLSGKLEKEPERYKKRTLKFSIMEKAFKDYKRIFGEYPKGFIDFFVTEDGIDFSDIPTKKIKVDFYTNFLVKRMKPLMLLFKFESREKDMKLTSYF